MTSKSSENTKRIAKNTGFLYCRMILIMLVTLYTSRVVLEQLGIDNYGVYIVVGGVVTMFGFLQSCMMTSTQRFLNFELGKDKTGVGKRISTVFSTALLIHIIISLVIIAGAETIGLWFVNHKLTIPKDSLYGANIVYQTAILSFCVSIIGAPYNAAIIAHEKMNIYAYVSILEAFLRLGIAFLLIIIPYDKLTIYGWLILAVQIVVTALYGVISMHKFHECSFHPIYDKATFHEMSGFAGWNLFGSLAWLVRGQGLGILLNIFFGPTLNAAKGVSDQISNAANTLNSNFQTALNPQITKYYAAGQAEEMEILAYRGIKFSTLLMWLIVLPLSLCSDAVLSIWLKEVPNYAPLFVVLILIDLMVGNLFGTPLMTSLSASGKIRSYQISVSIILLMVLPVAYLFLKLKWPPESIFYLNIFFNLSSGVLRYSFCQKQLGYRFDFYLKLVIKPILCVIAVSSLIMLFIKGRLIVENAWLLIFIISIISLLISLTCIYYIGLTKGEQLALKKIISSKILAHGKNM